jgi:hypothetical protein
MTKTVNIFFQFLIILEFLFCITACRNKTPKPVFDINSPGGEVVAMYSDSIPQIVFFYKIDEKGNKTQEKIGEAYYYENRHEYVGGGMKEGKREGKWQAFFRDGSLQTEAFYVDGKEHSAYNVYRENGNPVYKGHYDHGVCDGIWYWYDENGIVTKKIKADANTIACGYCSKCTRLK